MHPGPDSLPLVPVRRIAIEVRGVVQGVGFRPFVYQTAMALRLSGWARNEADAVQIEIEGPRTAVDAFVDALRRSHPPQARIETIDVREMPPVGTGAETSVAAFRIIASRQESLPQPTIPADLATCSQCLAELRDPSERRYRYPFTNCTNCGPRWSIIEHLPYDRARTSMSGFVMCAACRAEYENPTDRRFHAQPIACPRCGPQLQLLDSEGRQLAADDEALRRAIESISEGRIVALKGLGGFQLLADATDAEAVARLRERKHRPDRPFALMLPSLADVRHYCDVSTEEEQALTSHQAPIVLLRRLAAVLGATGRHALRDEGRGEPGNPALRCDQDGPSRESLNMSQGGQSHFRRPPLRTNLSVGARVRENWDSPQLPIADGVAPGNPYLGVMLPYTPLHHLLMDALRRPIICTSGNLSEEPMAITTEDAIERLGAIADLLLTHNRPIVRPVDDSIVRLCGAGVSPAGADVSPARAAGTAATQYSHANLGRAPGDGEMQVLRRARGFAPLPMQLAGTLSAGTEGDSPIFVDHRCGPTCRSVPVPAKIGTVPTILAVGGHLKNTVALLLGGGQLVMSAHVGDLESVASVEVSHRAVADLVEFFDVVPDAVACDLHPDYASTRHAQRLAGQWGVPLLPVQHHHAHVAAGMAEHGLPGPTLGFSWDGTGYGPDGTVWGGEVLLCEAATFRRVAHLRTFPLPGGDVAMRQPRRAALGMLFELFGPIANEYAAAWFNARELDTLLSMLERQVGTPRTSSMGRLFDAVAAICGLPPVISFEGQAAMALEFAADENEQAAYSFALTRDGGSSDSAIIIDWEPVIRSVLSDRDAGVPIGAISARFHNALAEMAVAIAQGTVPIFAGTGTDRQVGPQPWSTKLGLSPSAEALPCVLTGGCFQNALLTARVGSRLAAAGFSVYTHRQAPPGDGGIALGQAMVALAQLQGSTDVPRNSG